MPVSVCIRVLKSMLRKRIGIPMLIRDIGTGGARGARAPSFFWRARTKSGLESCKFAWLLSGVHTLIIAACYGPEEVAFQKFS